MKKEPLAQGEITIRFIESMPDNLEEHKEYNSKGQNIISHSERGSHHVLERPTKVMKPKKETREGLNIFYAIMNSDNSLIQDAVDAHGKHDFKEGDIVEFTIARDYDYFLKEARRVAD